MAALFDKGTDTIGLHLRNILDEGELEPSVTTEGSSVVQVEGKRQVRRKVRFYNLDAIISVGYQVNITSPTTLSLTTTTVPLTVTLQQGWNLIGNPTSETVTLPGGLTAYTYDGAGYVSTTTLSPGEGAWVNTDTAGDITLNAAAG